MRLIFKFFGQKFWLKNSFSKSTPNDPKREKRSPVLPIGRPAGPSGGPNLTGDRFFSVFITPNDPKREKNGRRFCRPDRI